MQTIFSCYNINKYKVPTRKARSFITIAHLPCVERGSGSALLLGKAFFVKIIEEIAFTFRGFTQLTFIFVNAILKKIVGTG